MLPLKNIPFILTILSIKLPDPQSSVSFPPGLNDQGPEWTLASHWPG